MKEAEKIIQALKAFDGKAVILYDPTNNETITFEDVIDYVIDLQSEVEEYEAVFDLYNNRKYRKMFIEEWKKEYQKELDKQGEGVIAGFPDSDYVYRRYFEQKAEIEQLTEVRKPTDDKVDNALENLDKICYEKTCSDKINLVRNFIHCIQNENAELQKQVDELKEERENMQAEIMRFEDMKFTQEHCNLYEENELLKDMLCQYMNGEIVNENVFAQQVEDMREAIKYTVKEFSKELLSTKTKITNDYYIFADNVKTIAKVKYDVEVE